MEGILLNLKFQSRIGWKQIKIKDYFNCFTKGVEDKKKMVLNNSKVNLASKIGSIIRNGSLRNYARWQIIIGIFLISHQLYYGSDGRPEKK